MPDQNHPAHHGDAFFISAQPLLDNTALDAHWVDSAKLTILRDSTHLANSLSRGPIDEGWHPEFIPIGAHLRPWPGYCWLTLNRRTRVRRALDSRLPIEVTNFALVYVETLKTPQPAPSFVPAVVSSAVNFYDQSFPYCFLLTMLYRMSQLQSRTI
jgi:hypothetical protein